MNQILSVIYALYPALAKLLADGDAIFVDDDTHRDIVAQLEALEIEQVVGDDCGSFLLNDISGEIVGYEYTYQAGDEVVWAPMNRP